MKDDSTQINVKYFMFLYKAKHLAPRTISKSILSIYNNISGNDSYVKFIFYIFFHDICPVLKCPTDFVNLLEHNELVEHIKTKFFEDKECNTQIKGGLGLRLATICDYEVQTHVKDAIKFVNLFLLIENNVNDFIFCDSKFMIMAIKSISDRDRIALLSKRSKITPIVIFLLLESKECDIPKQFKSFYYFSLALNKSPLDGMRFLDSRPVKFKEIEKLLLASDNVYIYSLYETYLNFYPESKLGSWLHPQRISFFEDPLNITLEYKTLKVYVPILLESLKARNPHLKKTLIDALYRLILIERLLKRDIDKLDCETINRFISVSIQLLTPLMQRRFDQRRITNLVKYTPAMSLAFYEAVEGYIKTNLPFYLTLLTSLLKKYPTRDNVKKILEKRAYLPPSLFIEFRELLAAYKEE